MEFISYKKIYSLNLLNSIKSYIRENKVKLYGDKEAETDKKILKIIEDLCGKSKNKLNEKEKNILNLLPCNDEDERTFCTLMLYYTALYNDNVSLLYELLESGYDFGQRKTNLNLFVLDKRISSQFNKDLYFYFIQNQEKLFKNFYYSLYDSDIEASDEEYIDVFCDILNIDPQVACTMEKNYYGEYVMGSLLTKESLTYFDQETILNATEEQKRNIISRIQYSMCSDEDLSRAINLMKYYDFSLYIYSPWSETLEQFTDEELIKINEHKEDLFYKYYDYKTGRIDFDRIREEICVIPKEIEEPTKRTFSLFKK